MRRRVSLPTRKSSPPPGSPCDYRIYRFSAAEWCRLVLEAAGGLAAVVYVFYRSWKVFFLCLPLALLWPHFRRDSFRKKRQEVLRLQFREGLIALSSALRAGYSVENAFAACLPDLREMYGPDGMITVEYARIVEQMRMNRTVESLVTDFAARSGVDEIVNFAEIFAVAKRSRGGVVSVITNVTHVISGRIQVREEILNMTAEKQFEQRIMDLIPFAMVLYIDLTSPGFFSLMYTTIPGRLVMTVCLMVYTAAILLARRILDIEI